MAVLMAVGCGNSTQKKAESAAPAAEVAPSVAVAQVFAQDVVQDATYTSTVQAYVKNNIVPQTAGRIVKINVEVGDRVKKGQVLAEIDKAQLQQAQLQLHNAGVELERLRALYQAGGLSKSDLDAIELQYNVAKTQVDNLIENTTLLSPIDGVITARNYDDGDMYGGQAILVVEQISPVKMKINVSESYYAKTNKDLDVTLKFEAYGDEEFKGNIDIIYPTISAASHTFPVEISMANKDMKIRPGMYGKAVVNFGTKEHVVVPDMAVKKQTGSGDFFVYTYENGKVKHNKVILGRRLDDRYELISGIESGAAVVVAGIDNLADGIEVEVIK